MFVRRVANSQRISWTDFGDCFVASHMGVFDVGSSGRVRDAAFWGSWAVCLEMVKATLKLRSGFRSQRSGCLSSVTRAVNRLLKVGVHVPEWKEIADGLRPQKPEVAEWESCPGRGWQRHASATIFSGNRWWVWLHLFVAEGAMVRFTVFPITQEWIRSECCS